MYLDEGVADHSVLEAVGCEYAVLFADMSSPYFSVGRYVRPIVPCSCFCDHTGAADGTNYERCNQALTSGGHSIETGVINERRTSRTEEL